MGYDITRFDCTVDDELICSICEGVLQNPIQVISCEHVFCTDCLDEWLAKGKKNCPLDREDINRNDMKTPRIVTNLLAKLSIKCDFANYGCNSIVKLEVLLNHCNQCPYNPNKPFKCEKGCGLVLANRCALEEHNCMEELHNLVRGQTEQIEGQQNQIDELKAELLTIRTNNQKIEEEFKQMKEIFSNFESKLFVEQNKSSKLMECLSKCVKEMESCQKQSPENGEKKILNNYLIHFKENCIEVDPYKRIGEIKQNLMKIFNIRSGKLKLFNGSNELEDMRSLFEYGIDQTPDTHLSLVQCDDVQVFVKIRVMNSKENVRHPYLSSDFLPKTVALRIDRNATIGQMKAEVRIINNIETEDVLLTYGTITLEDQFDLSYYNITDGSFINYYAHL